MTILAVMLFSFLTALAGKNGRCIDKWWDEEGIVVFCLLVPIYFVILTSLGMSVPANAGD